MGEEKRKESLDKTIETQAQLIEAQQKFIESLEKQNAELRKQLVIYENAPISQVQTVLQQYVKDCLEKDGQYPPKK